MKKTLLFLALIALVACSEDSDPKKQSLTKDLIVGTWTTVSNTYSGCGSPSPTVVPFDCNVYCQDYTFAEDGTFSYQSYENGDPFASATGDYSITDGVLTVGTLGTYALEITGSEMYWSFEDGGCPLMTTLSK